MIRFTIACLHEIGVIFPQYPKLIATISFGHITEVCSRRALLQTVHQRQVVEIHGQKKN